MTSLFTISAVLGLAFAQSTTITVPFPGYGTEDVIQASVISVNSAATTFSIACPPTADDCGFFPHMVLTYGPSTYKMDMAGPGDLAFTMTQDCSIGTSMAVCKESAGGSEANFPGTSTEEYEVASLPVTITAGAAKLSAEAKTTGEATPTSSGSAGTVASHRSSSNSTLGSPTQTEPLGSGGDSASPAVNTGGATRGMVANLGLTGAAAGLFAGLFM